MSPYYVLLAVTVLAVRHTSGQNLYGNCTQDQVNNFRSTLSADCVSNFAKTESASTVNDVNYDVYCADDCVGAAKSFARYNCSDALLAQIMEIECYKDTGMFGGRCLPVIKHQVDERALFAIIGNQCFTGSTCSANCSAALQKLNTNLGCCYESFFNNSPLLDGLYSNHTITLEQRKFFDMLGDSSLWTKCHVNELSPCNKQ